MRAKAEKNRELSPVITGCLILIANTGLTPQALRLRLLSRLKRLLRQALDARRGLRFTIDKLKFGGRSRNPVQSINQSEQSVFICGRSLRDRLQQLLGK